MTTLAIVNPASGGGKTRSEIKALARSLKSVAETVKVTEYPGHATELVRKSPHVEIFVVAGGDGTLFECINGIDREHGKTLALVPAGTGNSLAHNLGIPNWEAGVTNCISGKKQRIDTIRVWYKCRNNQTARITCLTTAGIGYPAETVMLGNRRFKHLKRWCYPVSGVIQSLRCNKVTGTAAIDNGEMDLSGIKGMFINNTEYAGNFRAFPHASISDGAFDVMTMTVDPVRQNIQNLMVLMGTHRYMPSHTCRAQKLSFELETPMPLMVDGEIIPDIVAAEFTIDPHSVTCLVPSANIFS